MMTGRLKPHRLSTQHAIAPGPIVVLYHRSNLAFPKSSILLYLLPYLPWPNQKYAQQCTLESIPSQPLPYKEMHRMPQIYLRIKTLS